MSSTVQQEKAKQRRDKFAALLRDMFQLDQPELDFGLYRILHARKDDVNRFIEQDLPSIAQDAFKDFSSQDKAQLEQEIAKARQAAVAAGYNPDEAPRVKELEAQYESGFDIAREEGEVYDALVTFFSRYYDDGDFISRRVYKDDTYAIPYQGEEVVLHWANKDQYYIKSSEALRDYTFRLKHQAHQGEDPQRVHFKLVDATAGAKDNIKETEESKRQFVLDAEQPFEFIDSEPNAEGKVHQELYCRFCFRPATEADWIHSVKDKATAAAKKLAPTQAHLLDITEALLLGADSALPEQWKTALAERYRKTDGDLADYSRLKGQLNNYTKKNTFDYFIHKDLGGFLTHELDFYIKNELMQWADFAALKDNPARLAPMLSKLDVTRTLGTKIIAFLAQLEDFQKKLWLKKKFVTETNYCITLDRVPEELYSVICENEAQLQEWIKLFAIDEIQGDLTKPAFKSPLTLVFLQANKNLVLDTRFFDEHFKAQIIASIESFDEQCDGLLIHSENFQALNLLQERYREQIRCVHIDPPYNTDTSGFLYKNTYEHSSWLSMMNDRISLASNLLDSNGEFICHIDENEYERLSMLFNNYSLNTAGTIIWDKKNPMLGRKGIATQHEYILWRSKYDRPTVGRSESIVSMQNKVEQLIIEHGGVTSEVREHYRKWLLKQEQLTGGEKAYRLIDEQGDIYRLVAMGAPERRSDQKFHIPLKHPITKIDCPVPPNGWSRTPDTLFELIEADMIVFGHDHKTQPQKKVYLKEDASKQITSVYSDGKSGKSYLDPLGLEFPYCHPVSMYEHLLSIADEPVTFLDFFAGSGTNGHAVLNLTRKTGQTHKSMLIEMGHHFDTVLKPRIIKVIYSSEWKNGKPVSRDTGISHCFKYIRLESYEDTLGNLRLERKLGQQSMFAQTTNDSARQAYVMNYMLDVETRGSQSLLNIQKFLDPTQYQLNVRSASGDETVPVNVDLLETFNYLLGLEVEHIAAPIYFDAELSQAEFGRWQAEVRHSENGQWWFRTVYGKNRNGQQVLVVWRNLPSVIAGEKDGVLLDNAVLDAVLVERLKIRLTESVDDEIDILYVNGDHNIHIPRDRQGQPMEQARVQLIEEAFHRLMFADTEAVH